MTQLTIDHVSYPTADAVTLSFKKPDEFPDYKPGQHGLFGFWINGERYVRNYSIHPDLSGDAMMAITIKKINHGFVSQFLHSSATSGVVVELDDVGGNFFIESSSEKQRHIIMFAGGSGITPLMAMIKSVLREEPMTHVSLIYSNKRYDQIIFRDELSLLQFRHSENFKVYHVLTGSEPYPEDFFVFHRERLTRLVTKKLIKNRVSEIANPAEVFVCGPHGLIDLVTEAVQQLATGLPVYTEHFFIPTVEKEFDFNRLESQQVVIRWREKNHEITVASGKTVLSAALEHGLALPHSCTEGQCGVCRSTLLSGVLKMRKNAILSEEEIQQGQVLLCQGYPISSDVQIQQGINYINDSRKDASRKDIALRL